MLALLAVIAFVVAMVKIGSLASWAFWACLGLALLAADIVVSSTGYTYPWRRGRRNVAP